MAGAASRVKRRRAKAPPKHPHVRRALQYARDVVAGRVLACKWVRLACRRHLDDLARAKAGWDYVFDPERAEHVCRFVELFPHVKGKWAIAAPGNPTSKLLRLEPWQCFVLCALYGWVQAEPSESGRHLRRFRLAYIAIPRKNAKSTTVAPLGLYHLTADGEPGAEVFCGATSKDQAFEVFRPAKQMAEAASSEGFRRTFGVEVAAESIFVPSTGSFFKPLIGKPGDGSSPSCYICDEYHEHPDDTQLDTMRTGMGAREQPLAIVITTAGEDIASPCHQLQKDVQDILEGTVTGVSAEETFGIIWTIDEGVEWTSEDALVMANPNYGVSVFPEQLRSLQEEAVRSPRKQNIFKTKRLNVWVHARDPWMNMEAWNRCADPALSVDSFAGEPCWMAMDLSSKIDLTAVPMLFRREIDGEMHYYVFGRYYLPEERANEPEKQHYQGWVVEGKLIATDGNTIDYEQIKDDILADAARFDVQELAFDPWNAMATAQELQKEGLTVVEVPQNVRHLSAPMKEIEALVLAGRFHHDGDPVLAWAMSNVTAKEDANENVFPRKEARGNKIDPAVAVITAMSRAMVAPVVKRRSVYETRGVRTY